VAEKWTRPEGLRPKRPRAALLVVHLMIPNLSPRALPEAFSGILAQKKGGIAAPFSQAENESQ
jgi:hypothetical protein